MNGLFKLCNIYPFQIAQCTDVKEMLLTDGNEQSVDSKSILLATTLFIMQHTVVPLLILVWEHYHITSSEL